jgi:hypothetical protein
MRIAKDAAQEIWTNGGCVRIGDSNRGLPLRGHELMIAPSKRPVITQSFEFADKVLPRTLR